jgi:hypothetical protein
MAKVIFLIAMLAVLAIGEALAQEPLTVSVVIVRGSYELRPVQVHAAVRLALSDLSRQTGVKFRIYHWMVEQSADDRSPYDSGRACNLYAWRDWFDAHGIDTPVRLVVAPPMIGAWGWPQFGGMADKVCALRTGAVVANVGFAHGHYKRIRTFFNAVTIIEHEVAHQIGAFHDPTGRTLMSSLVLGARVHQDYQLPMTPRSIAEIQACVAKEAI